MNYAERNLNKNETIVLQAKKSFWAVVPVLLWCIVLLVAVIVVQVKLGELVGDSSDSDVANTIGLVLWGVWALIGLIPVIIKIIRLACTCLCITNKRVIGKVGVLKLSTLDYPIDKVDNVSLKAGVFGNIFRYHTVIVLGGGGSDAKIKFTGISNATKFKNSVTEAVEKHAEEARRAQAEEIARAMAVNK